MATLACIIWILCWLLKFDALLDTSTNTRQLSTVSLLLPAHITDLVKTNNSQCCTVLMGSVGHKLVQFESDEASDRKLYDALQESMREIQTCPFLRILARLNFSLFLTLGLRSIFFLFGVSPLFLAIC